MYIIVFELLKVLIYSVVQFDFIKMGNISGFHFHLHVTSGLGSRQSHRTVSMGKALYSRKQSGKLSWLFM